MLIRNRLNLNEPDIQMKWHVGYYDNLGDMFDVVSTNNNYTVNRNASIDLSKSSSSRIVSSTTRAAIYVLSTLKAGMVSIQFEAHSDGYLNLATNDKSGLSNVIKSQTR